MENKELKVVETKEIKLDEFGFGPDFEQEACCI